MIKTNGLISSTAFYDKTIQKKTNNAVKKNNNISKEPVKSNEDKLSTKAKEYLNNLRKEYGDYDFIIADKDDDRKALLDSSDKEFSIMLSTAEIERMANDEAYASEKMRKVQTIVDMSDRICDQFGFERGWNKNGENGISLNKLAVSVNDDGTMSIFAELEKMSEKHMEHIEKMKDKHANEKKAADKLDEKIIDTKVNSYKKDDPFSKKLIVEASSEEELIDKITNIDWNKATGVNAGAKIDFIV